jgi:uncharacterized cupredoxin-like copper-binding protein
MNALLAPLLISLTLLGAAPVWAHGEEAHAKKTGPVVKEQKPWGIAGDARAVKRTIAIAMSDDMRFTPASIEVNQGDTVRLTLTNSGGVMHELVIGTQQELAEHAALMKRFPNMEHEEPYMAHVAPGKTGEIIWTFNRSGDFEFACLLPGHFEAGMVGRILVKASKGTKP